MIAQYMVELEGHVMTSVNYNADEEIIFTRADGRAFKFYHSQSCCEDVRVDDISGDLSDLVGLPLLLAEQVSEEQKDIEDGSMSETWTFYRFATAKGSVTVKWYGRSNGYYSERVDFKEVTEEPLEVSPERIDEIA